MDWGSAEHRAVVNLRRAFVEFLRAISRQDNSFAEYDVMKHLVEAQKAMKELAEKDGSLDAVLDEMRQMIEDAEARDKCWRDDLDGVASASAKVLAERMSGQATQLNLARSRLHDATRHLEEQRAERRRHWSGE